MGCYIRYSEEGTGRGRSPRCTKCNSPSINGQCYFCSVEIIDHSFQNVSITIQYDDRLFTREFLNSLLFTGSNVSYVAFTVVAARP